MPQGRYAFNTLFDYDATNGILIPRFDLVINNTLLPKGVAISKSTFTGGLNLFNYVGRALAGTWNPVTKQLTVAGFY
jgi:hypothetical protein